MKPFYTYFLFFITEDLFSSTSGIENVASPNFEREPVQGYDLHTTIDIEIQDIVHHELLSQLEKFEADHGTMILMETNSGKIKGISNLGRTEKGKYFEKINYGIWESQEPGSTFKLMTLIAALV